MEAIASMTVAPNKKYISIYYIHLRTLAVAEKIKNE